MNISVFGEQHKILLVFTVKTANFFLFWTKLLRMDYVAKTVYFIWGKGLAAKSIL